MLKKIVSAAGYNRMEALVREHIRADARIEGTYFFDSNEGQTRGILCLRPLSRYLTEVKHLLVLPEYRGQGIACSMLSAVEERTSRTLMCATVLADNTYSCRVFESSEYREVERFMQEDRLTILFMKKRMAATEAVS